jgi:hypothetical protein
LKAKERASLDFAREDKSMMENCLKSTPNWDDCDWVGWMAGACPEIAEVGKTLPLITLMPLINTDRGKTLPLMNADKRGSAQISHFFIGLVG